MNPALLGRAFLLASWPVHMTKDWLQPFWWKQEGFSFFTWKVPLVGPDAVTTATPLEVKKTALGTISEKANLDASIVNQAFDTLDQVSGKLMSLLVGTVGGCIGETSAILLLVGAVYLLYKNYIDWRVPFSFIGVVALGGWLFGGPENLFGGDPLFHIFAGGLILGAFYMATDMVTTPLTAKGRLIFGAGAGLLTLMIRLIGGYPEGVSYAILLMNLTTPLIDRYTVPRRFGSEPKQSGGEGER
jgi:electron transport complex protein RnfD